jgi:hypothetical protein
MISRQHVSHSIKPPISTDPLHLVETRPSGRHKYTCFITRCSRSARGRRSCKVLMFIAVAGALPLKVLRADQLKPTSTW